MEVSIRIIGEATARDRLKMGLATTQFGESPGGFPLDQSLHGLADQLRIRVDVGELAGLLHKLVVYDSRYSHIKP